MQAVVDDTREIFKPSALQLLLCYSQNRIEVHLVLGTVLVEPRDSHNLLVRQATLGSPCKQVLEFVNWNMTLGSQFLGSQLPEDLGQFGEDQLNIRLRKLWELR